MPSGASPSGVPVSPARSDQYGAITLFGGALSGDPCGGQQTPSAELALPDGVVVHRRAGRAPYDVVVAFRRDAATLQRHIDRDIARTAPPSGRLWLAWPKRASGVATDLSDGAVRAAGLDAGVVDTKVCAIDATWSGLMFVRRLADR